MSHCELCTAAHPKEVWRNEHFYLIDASSDEFPCFLRLVSTRHVAEMSDLPQSEREELWLLLDRIERTMREMMHPDKVNLAQFGNMVPHVHWHVIARWRDDVYFPECPWGKRQKDTLPAATAQRRALTGKLIEALAKAL